MCRVPFLMVGGLLLSGERADTIDSAFYYGRAQVRKHLLHIIMFIVCLLFFLFYLHFLSPVPCSSLIYHLNHSRRPLLLLLIIRF